jgi:hypothetical protein
MPPEHEAPVRAFYDHEDDEPRGGRRRRAVADWGVSEDAFDRMPSRRFSRRGEEPREIGRRGEESREIARRGEEPREIARRGEEPREIARRARPAPVSRTIAIEREPDFEPAPEEDSAPELLETPRVTSADGRRTVVIGGHPDRLPAARARRPRSALDRVGPRPDRIVGYSVALGFLLILIAILTSH